MTFIHFYCKSNEIFVFVCSGEPGIKVDINDQASSWDYFNLFIGEDVLEEMMRQTNLYAAQYKEAAGDNIKPNNLLKDWKNITIPELKVFIGLLFLMGVVKKPDVKSYWSTNPLIETPFFGKTMARNRFEAILMAFHLNDNNNNLPKDHPNYDKLFKVRPLITRLQEKFASTYVPKQNLAIDESMMPW